MELRKFDRFLAILRPEEGKLPRVKSTNNTMDIPGAQPDAYGKLKFIHGRDYNNINDIEGAKPAFLIKRPFVKVNDYKLMSKDVTEQNKRILKKNYNPLDPRYILSTKSGRKQIIGVIDQNKPKVFTKPTSNKDTRRYLRTDDIDGAQPFYKRNQNLTGDISHQKPSIHLLKDVNVNNENQIV